MSHQQNLKQSAILSLVAFILLIATGFAANTGPTNAGQELFEVLIDQAEYSAALELASPALRMVLFIDSIFALAYTSAICCALIGFYRNNPPFAWFATLAIIAVMLLDYWENITMGQSIDIVQSGADISMERILYQASISAIKWHLAAACLFAVSFVLPNTSLLEKLLVWGTRLGLTIAVPLFVLDAFDLRELGALMIGLSMAGGFLLLAVVTWRHSKA